MMKIAAWLSLFVFVVGSFFVWWDSKWQDVIQAVTAQDGMIIVNSPTVYTRQRLVNDRLSQTAWLQDQLFVTKEVDPTFRSVDQVRLHRSSHGIEIGMGTNGLPTKDETTKRTSSFPTQESVAAGSESDEAAAPQVDPTTLDLFRAKNNYREEVRAEMMETQLDDRHDIRGNTIYRLAFDATILAGTKKDSLAVIKIKLSHDWDNPDFAGDYEELYAEWLRHMQSVFDDNVRAVALTLIQRSIAGVPDLLLHLPTVLTRGVCYDLTINSLMETEEAPPDNKKYDLHNSPCNEKDSTQAKTADEFLQKYISLYVEKRRGIIEEIARSNIASATSPRNHNSGSLSISPQILMTLENTCRKNAFGANADLGNIFADINVGSGNLIKVNCPIYDDPTVEALIGGILLLETVAKRHPITMQQALAELEERFDHLKKQCGPINASCKLPGPSTSDFTCFAADYVQASVNAFWDRPQPGHDFDDVIYFMDANVIGRQTQNCRLVVSRMSNRRPSLDSVQDKCERGKFWTDPVGRLKCRLNDATEVYSYSISPKNLVQRVSTLSDTRDALQALFNAHLGTQGSDLQSLFQILQQESNKARAIESNPIVIGFSLPSGKSWADKQKTEFGWAIAPQLRVEGRREQVDGQYDLAAVISVPSWWRSVRLEIKRCWLPRETLHKTEDFGACPGKEEISGDLVRLPGDIRGVSEKLRFDVVQEPHLSIPGNMEPYGPAFTLQVGEPADLILTGGRLWRSTEVTLGAQTANEIVVLPNMEGIIAKFKCIKPQQPLNSRSDQNVDIRVWTSEGVTQQSFTAKLVTPDKLVAIMDKMEEAAERRGDKSRPVVCSDSAPDLRGRSLAANPEPPKKGE
jgi:hypothetical protein